MLKFHSFLFMHLVILKTFIAVNYYKYMLSNSKYCFKTVSGV